MRPLLYFILLSIKIKFTGVSVVGESWLVESKASKRLVDPWPHILKVKTCIFVDRTLNKSRFNFILVKEPAAEKKLGIRLEESIRMSKMKPLLSGDKLSLIIYRSLLQALFYDVFSCAR